MSESKDDRISIRCPKHKAEKALSCEKDLVDFLDEHRRCGCLETHENGALTGTYSPPEEWMN